MLGTMYVIQAAVFGLIVAVSSLTAFNKFTRNDTAKVAIQILAAVAVAALVFFVANPMLGPQILCEVTHIMGARTAEGTSAFCVMNP